MTTSADSPSSLFHDRVIPAPKLGGASGGSDAQDDPVSEYGPNAGLESGGTRLSSKLTFVRGPRRKRARRGLLDPSGVAA